MSSIIETSGQTYCNITRLLPQYGDYIINVTYAGVNNSTTYASGVGLVDYTAKIANVVTEVPAQLSVTYKVTTGGPDYVYAYIDWNGNGKLNDAGEVYTLATNKGNTPGGAGGSGSTVSVSVTPPKLAALKDVRMRILIVTDEDGIGADPCIILGWGTGGEAEDYTVRITGPSAPAMPGNFTASKAGVCKGAAGVLYTVPKVTGATGYTWSYTPSAGVTVNQLSDTAVTLDFSAGAASGTLSVTANNSVGPSAPRSMGVTVNSLPVIQPLSNTAVCAGSSTTLKATPSGGSWSSAATGVATVGSTSGLLSGVSVGSSAITYTYTDANSCTGTASMTTTVNTLPAAAVTPSGTQTVCKGDSLLLTASAGTGVSYEWKRGATQVGTAAGTFKAGTAGDYTVTVTNTSTNCKATSAATTLSVRSLSTGAVSPAGPVAICEDDSVVLTLGSATTGYSYQWKNGTAPVGTGGSSYTVKSGGTYKVVVTEGLPYGCTDSSQAVTVTVSGKPSAAVSTGDTSFCEGGILTLKAVTQDTGLEYRWSKDAVVIPQATTDSLDVRTSGIYTLVLYRSSLTGCADTTVPVTVTVHPLPSPGLTWDGKLLHATPGYAHYQWQAGTQPVPGATDSIYEVTAKGNYTVSVTDTNGCSNTATYNVLQLHAATVLPGANGIGIYPNPVSSVLFISSPVRVDALLSGMDGRAILHRADVREINLEYLADGVYLLRLTDQHGHILRHEKLVKKSGTY